MIQAQALDVSEAAAYVFVKSGPSCQREQTDWVNEAKRQEIRDKHLPRLSTGLPQANSVIGNTKTAHRVARPFPANKLLGYLRQFQVHPVRPAKPNHICLVPRQHLNVSVASLNVVLFANCSVLRKSPVN